MTQKSCFYFRQKNLVHDKNHLPVRQAGLLSIQSRIVVLFPGPSFRPTRRLPSEATPCRSGLPSEARHLAGRGLLRKRHLAGRGFLRKRHLAGRGLLRWFDLQACLPDRQGLHLSAVGGKPRPARFSKPCRSKNFLLVKLLDINIVRFSNCFLSCTKTKNISIAACAELAEVWLRLYF